MKFDAGSVKSIATMVFALLLIAGIGTLLVPLLLGIGSQAGTAMGVGTTAAYNATELALENTTSAQGTVFQFLPWLGVGLVVLGAIGIKKIL